MASRLRSTTVATAVEEYLALRVAQRGASTIQNYRTDLRHFLRYLHSRSGSELLQCRSLTPTLVEGYFYEPIHGSVHRLKETSFNRQRSVLKNFIAFCEARQYCDPGIMDHVEYRREPQVERTRLTVQQLVGLLDMADHARDRMALALAINTGLRRSEIASLRIKDIDLDSGYIHTVLHKNKKEDMFPISVELDRELRRWYLYYQEEQGALDPNWYVVPAKDKHNVHHYMNGERVTPRLRPLDSFKHMERMMHKYFKELGIDEKGMGMHAIRRSVARAYYDHALEQEGSRDQALRITQALLNHSTITTTERYIGMKREREVRDETLRGRPFLSAMLPTGDNVVPLRREAASE